MAQQSEIVTKVGPAPGSDGQLLNARGSRDGSLIVQDGHGRYQEAVLRGSGYGVSNQAAVTVGNGLSATIATLAIYNPPGSGKYAVLLSTRFGCTALSAAHMSLNYAMAYGVTTAPSTPTLATIRNLLTGQGGSVCTAYTAGTSPVTPVFIHSFTHVPTTGPVFPMDDVGGIIIVPPSSILIMQGIGSTCTGLFSLLWEEVPV